jgi:hypothetical protein
MEKTGGSAEETDQECRMIPYANALVKPKIPPSIRREQFV